MKHDVCTGLGAAALFFAASCASAQVYYGGYNLGPDYGAMVQQQLQQGQVLDAQIQQAQQAAVQRTMQDPNCAARYREHLAAGGQLSYAQFAYQYAATGGFSAEGMARYRSSEQANQQRERAAWNGYRSAQDQRGAVQQEYANGYARNQNEAGEVMRGNSAWIDPLSGQTRELSYIGANAYSDPQTGQQYRRDDYGRYYVQGSDGLWYAMTPGQ